jgi:hypothetical protein
MPAQIVCQFFACYRGFIKDSNIWAQEVYHEGNMASMAAFFPFFPLKMFDTLD